MTEGGEKCVQMLLKSGCNANINRADGVRPLHVAASEGHFGVVRLLLADGADPLLVNDNGETPLQVACGTSHPGTLSVVQLLLEHVQAGSGSAATYVNTRNTLGETCLHAASSQPRTSNTKGKYPDRDIAQFLLQAGGDVGLDTCPCSLTGQYSTDGFTASSQQTKCTRTITFTAGSKERPSSMCSPFPVVL